MERHALKEEQFAALLNNSDQSVHLFVKDGEVTIVLDSISDTSFLVQLFAHVVAMVTLDSEGGDVLH